MKLGTSHLAIVAVVITVSAIAWFVWPTPWHYEQLDGELLRTHGVTSAVHRYDAEEGEWIDLAAERRRKEEKALIERACVAKFYPEDPPSGIWLQALLLKEEGKDSPLIECVEEMTLREAERLLASREN